MTAAAPDTDTGRHPFTAALAGQDIEALVGTLAPDVVLHSAVTGTPFEGRDVLRDIYASLFEAFEEFRVTEEFASGDVHVFFWEGRIDGRYVAGADRIEVDGAGQVRDITIVGRPMAGLSGFLSGLGYHFARRRRGPVVARVLRILALPLGPLFASLDVVTRWLARGKAA
jgi:ketosteroid isomerase-like protein